MITRAPVPDVLDFLRAHPPFDTLDPSDVERVAAAVEAEVHPAGTTIFSEGAEPVEYLRVVRSGAVEILHDERVLDLLGEGELFGHASMLSGLPAGFEARAQQDTLCYRIPADVARGLLGRPEGLRFVARSLLLPRSEALSPASTGGPARDPSNQPVAALIRSELVMCPPHTPLREAAVRMAEVGTTSLVVDLGDSLGILTDRDLRARVVAAGMSLESPVSEAMSAPAYTVAADRLGGDVLLDMLDRGFRHFPVVSATGRVLGVVEEGDLVAAQTRSSFYLRRRIARAKTPEDLVGVAGALRGAVIGLSAARVDPLNVSATFSVVVDALTRRLIEFAQRELGEPPAPFAWLALGSLARREATPASDVDSAIVWFDNEDNEDALNYLKALGERVVDGLVACGFRPDAHRATASDALVVRSLESWQQAVRSWLEDPTQEQALILVSVLVDSRPVWGVNAGSPVADSYRVAPQYPGLMRQLARLALSYRPPTGFLRGLVVEHSGEHRGLLDLKHGGVVPIVDLARWAGMAAGVTSASTVTRLRAAGRAGRLSPTDARTLEDAYGLIAGLRLEHQVRQLAAGQEADDFLDLGSLSPLTRSHLREAFRAVASVQKRVAGELQYGLP